VPAWPWQAERETDLRRAKAKGATVLAHRLRLYLALHEGADALDGRSRFGKDPRPDLPGVRHPRPYFEFDPLGEELTFIAAPEPKSPVTKAG